MQRPRADAMALRARLAPRRRQVGEHGTSRAACAARQGLAVGRWLASRSGPGKCVTDRRHRLGGLRSDLWFLAAGDGDPEEALEDRRQVPSSSVRRQ